jgi:putative alpha-1,2-mannosidase
MHHAIDILILLKDTFRAEWAWLILLAPERISGMVQSMIQDYREVRYKIYIENTRTEVNCL